MNLCNFMLVSNNNYGHVSRHFGDMHIGQKLQLTKIPDNQKETVTVTITIIKKFQVTTTKILITKLILFSLH